MNTVQILLLSTLIFFIIYWYISKADLLSPAKVFGVIWGVSIFLALFKFSGYQFGWSEYNWFVLLLGLLSFLLGVFIIFAINSDKNAHTVPEIRKYFLSGNCIDSFKLSAAIKVLFFSYLVALLVEIAVFGTVPILSSKPDFARVKFGLYGVHLLVNIIPALLFLCVEYLVFNFKNKRGKLFVAAIFLVASVSYFLLLERFNYFFAFIMCLGLLYYATDLMKFKRINTISR